MSTSLAAAFANMLVFTNDDPDLRDMGLEAWEPSIGGMSLVIAESRFLAFVDESFLYQNTRTMELISFNTANDAVEWILEGPARASAFLYLARESQP
jgi:hypothetical protein